MRAAKDGGGISSLYPGGSVWQAPHALVVAVNEALRVLGYLELPEEDQPPELYWHAPHLLEEWWKAVRQRRKSGGSRSASMEVIEDAEAEYEDLELSNLRKA